MIRGDFTIQHYKQVFLSSIKLEEETKLKVAV
jgi:hypothetical protein